MACEIKKNERKGWRKRVMFTRCKKISLYYFKIIIIKKIPQEGGGEQLPEPYGQIWTINISCIRTMDPDPKPI